MEHAVFVDANALAKLDGSTERHNGCEIESAASSESNSILAWPNLTRPIILLRKSGNEAAPLEPDQRADNLRQVLLNIKSRRAKG